MINLFKTNLSEKHLDNQNNLKANIAFCNRLVDDLISTFEVIVEQRRSNETKHEVVVYQPMQAGRFGFGFTFTATPEGVTFEDGRGVWLSSMAIILNVKITDQWEAQEADRNALTKAAEKLGISLRYTKDQACGDKFGLVTKLSPDDKLLNEKIKKIIATMLAQDVVTKL